MKNSTVLRTGRIIGLCRRVIILLSVIAVIMLLLSEISGVIGGRVPYSYELGCSIVNYSAGFVRRGLLGEIILIMDHILQPILSVIVMSFISLAFILCLIVRRMTKLGIQLPYILTIIFSPSLILMHRGEEFVRLDSFVFAINIAVSCFLLHMLAARNKKSGKLLCGSLSFRGMLFIDAVLFLALTAAALIHEMSAALLPPVILLFFILSRKAHRMMHCVFICVSLLGIYFVTMRFFTFSDSDIIADSWKGVFTSPDSFRYNDGLLSTVDKVRALELRNTTKAAIMNFSVISLSRLLIAVFLPFLVLLLSEIRIFSSSSWRATVIRCLLILSCLAPLGLCFAGFDFGRWFSLCALNLVVYTLLIARPVLGVGKCCQSYSDKKVKALIIKTCLLLSAFVLLNFRMNCFGEFKQIDQSVTSYFQQSASDSWHLPLNIRPFILRDKVMEPQNNWELPPWRKHQ